MSMNHQSEQELLGGVEGTPNVQKRMLTVCGGPVCVYEAGESDCAPIVLLHGAMYDESRFIWDQLFPYLAADHHVFAVDTPRHGKSRPWEGVLNQAKLLEVLGGVFDALQSQRFQLVGLSMGGALAIGYAAQHPDRVQSMVLFEPGELGEKLDAQFVTWLYIKTPGMLRILSKS